MVQMTGKYRRKEFDNNFDLFLQKLGMGWFIRKAAQTFNSTMEVVEGENGGKWKMSTTTPIKTFGFEFDLVSLTPSVYKIYSYLIFCEIRACSSIRRRRTDVCVAPL